jgi:DNA-binding response OmpR family regulator
VKSISVLIVEDDVTIAGMLDAIFRRAGFSPTLVRDGRSAITFIDTGEPPAVAVIDVMLPYIDGFSVVAAMRRAPRWAEVPVMMLSSRQLPDDVVRAKELGVREYLQKPFNARTLLATVREMLGLPPG